jgi:peroxiredoxin
MPTTIADQVDTFNIGFNEAIGPDLAAVFATEQADLNAGGAPADAVKVGDSLPEAQLVDHKGNSVALHDVLGDSKAVLVFYRGAWCPYCNLTLKHYQAELLPELEKRGVKLIAISPQTPEGSEAAIANGELEYSVLSDPHNVLVSKLGILTEPSSDARAAHTALGFDVADSNVDATGNIPFPTVLVLDSAQVVTFADVHVDYTVRTEVSEILAAVDL